MFMKILLIVLSGLTLLLFACNTTKDKQPDQAEIQDNEAWNPLLHDIWVLTDINDRSLEGILKRPRLELFPSDNRMGGNGSCNDLFGNIKTTAQTIHFSKMGSTKMYCSEMDMETEFLKTLALVNQYQIKGLKLYLLVDKKVVLVFQKVD